MVHSTAITFAAAALLAASSVNAGLYSKTSPVIQLDGKSYDRLIAQSNYTSIVEFYAPWCGHCKNLQPAYEKAAKSLAGLAKVAAIDCDEEKNKQFCGSMEVKGFPTLKIVRPGKKPGRPIVEDYQGPRTAKGIVEAITDKIPNLVKKVEDKNLESWLESAKGTPRAILFTDKGKTSSLLKAIAIEFKGSIEVAQIRDKEKASMELFGIAKTPTLLLLPTGEKFEVLMYDGELKKDPIVKFLSQAATPNPDPAPVKAKASKPKEKKEPKKEAKKSSAAKEKFEESSASQEKQEASSQAASATAETVVDPSSTVVPPVDESAEKPAVVRAPPISLLELESELKRECLGPRTGTCILALLPLTPAPAVMATISALSEVAHKHRKQGRKTFPFFAMAPTNPGLKNLREDFNLGESFEVIAINGRRNWWRKLPRTGDTIEESDISEDIIENWVENIKLGEGAKQRLPEGVIPEEPVVEEPVEEAAEPVKVAEEPVKAEEKPVEEPVVVEKTDKHDEL